MKDIYVENMDKILERETRISMVLEKTETLKEYTLRGLNKVKRQPLMDDYLAPSRRVRRRARNGKCWAILLTVIIIGAIAGIFVLYTCGGYDL